MSDDAREGVAALLASSAAEEGCADCGARLEMESAWASVSLGCFLCIRCAGAHRGLGVHLSQVRSVRMDAWTREWADAVRGANAFNEEWEHSFSERAPLKPRAGSGAALREAFIRAKYEARAFHRDAGAEPSEPRLDPDGDGTEEAGDEDGEERKGAPSASSSSSSVADADLGMVESTGIVMLFVDTAEGLPAADVGPLGKSDPYVVLRNASGTQEARTSVKKRTLSPAWREKLSLTVAGLDAPAQVVVYDHDAFTDDDLLGRNELDLGPLADGQEHRFEIPLLDEAGRAVSGEGGRLARLCLRAQYIALQ